MPVVETFSELMVKVQQNLETVHMTASVNWSPTTSVMSLCLFSEDVYEWDIRDFGDMVAVNGVMMTPNAELIFEHLMETSDDAEIEAAE